MITAIINARTNSERLPLKHLYKIGTKTLFEHIIDKLKKIKKIKRIYIATGSKVNNYQYEAFLKKKYKNEIKFFYFNEENNVTKRIYKLTKRIDTKFSLMISGDCPLIDINFIQRLIKKIDNKKNYDFIYSKKKLIHEGIKLFKTSAWKKVFKMSKKKIYLEHPGFVIKDMPEHFKMLEYKALRYEVNKKYRISVDTLSDLNFLNYLYYNLKKKRKNFNLQNILKLKNVKKLNKYVLQRKPEDKKIKIAIITAKNPVIGLGHYKRSLSLKREFTERLNSSVKIYEIKFDTNTKSFSRSLFKINEENNLKIFDLPQEFIKKIKKKINIFSNVLIIDQIFNNKKFTYLIPNYYKKNNQDLKIYGGLNFLILDREINFINSIFKNTYKSIDKLLIIGGSYSVDDEILDFMEDNIEKLKILIGPLVSKKIIKKLNNQGYNLILDSKNIYKYIKISKQIFCKFGVSVFEVIALKKKPVVFYKNNQKDKKTIFQLKNKKNINIFKKRINKKYPKIDINYCYNNLFALLKNTKLLNYH